MYLPHAKSLDEYYLERALLSIGRMIDVVVDEAVDRQLSDGNSAGFLKTCKSVLAEIPKERCVFS